jgi:hypothetical protein
MKAFRSVSNAKPCLICFKSDWCSISSDGQVSLCRRIPNKNEKIDKNGTPYWVWTSDSNARNWIKRPKQPLLSPQLIPELASPELLHLVNSNLLDSLTLDPHHRRNLADRGFTTDEMVRNGYRTLPRRDRRKLAKGVELVAGSRALSQTPGFILKDGRY